MTRYYVKPYRRSDGTLVRGHYVESSGTGRSRGRKSPGARYSASKGYQPWIKREGKLGGSGFLSKATRAEHALLDRCVRGYGYRSCLGSLMVLNRNKEIKARHSKKIDALKRYLEEKYGGQGSFGSERKRRRSPSRRSRTRASPRRASTRKASPKRSRSPRRRSPTRRPRRR